MLISNQVFQGDCRTILRDFPDNSISACITDPPYNYEFVGHKWDAQEIERRIQRVQDSKTLVKNIPYGSGLAGGVRNKRWYERVQQNILDYQAWCCEWAQPLMRVLKPGAFVAVFNSTRTFAHVQVALEQAGFFTRDCLVYRRNSGIPKGLNLKAKLEQLNHPDAADWDGWHSCLRNEWEAILIAQKPLENNYTETFLKYNVGLFHAQNGGGGFQSNILEDIPRDDDTIENVHCTVKPLALMEKLVKLLVPPSPDHIVLDPFAGSGTTLVAAQNRGLSYVGIEIVPQYLEIIQARLTKAQSTNAQFDTAPRSATENP